MSIAFKAGGRSGDYIKASLVHGNHSEEAHFGLLDSVIVTFFLLCMSGLVYVLLRAAGQ